MLALATLLFVGVGTTNSAQAAPKKPALVQEVTGKTADGVPVTGQYKITKFVTENGKLMAKGTFTGTLGSADDVVKKAVSIPVSGPEAAATGDVGAAASCQILNLVLGPLDLNLLGLVVHLDTVHLNITAQSGSGNLLGNLLCAVAGLLDSQGLAGVTDAIAQLLNIILANLNL